jgi:hypothetical protein
MARAGAALYWQAGLIQICEDFSKLQLWKRLFVPVNNEQKYLSVLQ